MNEMCIERLRELLDYDPETGVFTWRVANSNRAKAGSRAGTKFPSGYVNVQIDGRRFFLHRLAWAHHYGQWPPEEIDHENGVRSDNRIDNIRLSSSSENKRNKGAQSNNKTGFKGVVLDKRAERMGHPKKYMARVCVNGKRFSLGYHATPEEAHEAYKAAAIKYHGEFARAE